MRRILLLQPELSGRELEYLRDALESGWITTEGPHVERLEVELCELTERKHALVTNTGTAALHLAFCVLDVGPGDYVICPTFTFAATAFPILYVNATPVFIDCDPSTQVSPTGTTSDTTPTYTWNEVGSATSYLFQVNNASGSIFGRQYAASSICSGGTCTVSTPLVPGLSAGAHTWYVLASNSAGNGPWVAKAFTVQD